MRDTRLLIEYANKMVIKTKEKLLHRLLRKEVDTGANGTQQYMIKKGANTGRIAKK